ncbi:MAG: regulatory protein RecX, partial [Candidatus Binatia bacterium]
PPPAVEEVVRRLQRLHYLDDRRFAYTTAEQALRHGRGSEYVRARLAADAVADTLIDEAIGATFGDETAHARRVLARRYPVESRRPGEGAKAARFLARRGFPDAVVLAILDEGCY